MQLASVSIGSFKYKIITRKKKSKLALPAFGVQKLKAPVKRRVIVHDS